jgi:hypothetical protein
MKKITLLLLMLPFAIQSFSQSSTKPTFSKEDYMTKSRINKTAAWVLLGSGAGLIIAGVIVQVNDIANYVDVNTNGETTDDVSVTGFIMLGAGIGTACSSIPFFIGGAKNKRRAAKVAFINQKILMPQKNSFAFKSQPALSIKISL